MMKAELSARTPKLDQLQQWMQTVVTHPEGIASGIDSEEAQSALAVGLNTLDSVLAPSARLSSGERLAIYCGAYHARLLQCFQSMFPVLFQFLGDELFNRFALDYLGKHPPHSYTLNRLADNFVQHLAETRPDAEAPPDQREQWPDFIIDLATLEWAFQKVYDGPGVEGRPVPSAKDLREMSLESILECRPVPVPCLRLFALRYPVHAYLLAVSRGEDPEMPAPASSFVAMTRRNYRVKVYELSPVEYEVLSAVDGHNTVGQALDRLERLVDFSRPEADSIVSWLEDWVAKGFLAK